MILPFLALFLLFFTTIAVTIIVADTYYILTITAIITIIVIFTSTTINIILVSVTIAITITQAITLPISSSVYYD